MDSSSSSPPALPALATRPSHIFFTDFDGTITQQDSNDHLTDTLGFGATQRRQLNADVLAGRLPFRDAFRRMLDSVTAPYAQCLDALLQHISLDPGFGAFRAWAAAHNVPIVVLSGGMRPVIGALLARLLGPDAMRGLQVVSNEVAVRPGKTSLDDLAGWEIVFRDESGFGHDKAREIAGYKALPEGDRPALYYAGDGVSDLSAARETDLLFAKEGRGRLWEGAGVGRTRR